MADISLARDLLFVFLAALTGGVLAKVFRLPLIVGYLVSGIFAGTVITRFFPVAQTVQSIAELGVALLLFTLGLEFSTTKLKELGEVVILCSFIQILLSILLGLVFFPLLGFDFYSSLFFGSVFSLSSTAVVLSVLAERGEVETLHGEIAAGWLLMQDLYALPMIILLPTIGNLINRGGAGGPASIVPFLTSLLTASGTFIVLLLIGKKSVPFLFEKIALLRSRELLLISAVSLCLLFSYIFFLLGLSFALGAFLAGILLGSSAVHHGIFAEVRPLRDLFSTVFFVSLGFIVNPGYIYMHFPFILGVTVFVMVSKFLISELLVLVLRYHTKTATLVSFSLTSVGEFAFIIALLGFSLRLITRDVYMSILSVTFLSLIISTPLVTVGEKIYYGTKKFLEKFIPGAGKVMNRLDHMPLPSQPDLENHIVVLGHGRVGKYISRALTLAKVPFIVVDYNYHLIKYLKKNGIRVVYGDPAEIDVLIFAGVRNARGVILAYADRHTQETVVTNVISLNSKALLICRTHHEEDAKKLESLGAMLVVQPEFEAALTMTKRMFQNLNLYERDIVEKLEELHKEFR